MLNQGINNTDTVTFWVQCTCIASALSIWCSLRCHFTTGWIITTAWIYTYKHMEKLEIEKGNGKGSWKWKSKCIMCNVHAKVCWVVLEKWQKVYWSQSHWPESHQKFCASNWIVLCVQERHTLQQYYQREYVTSCIISQWYLTLVCNYPPSHSLLVPSTWYLPIM